MVVEMRPAGKNNRVPLAEGCGARATYLRGPSGQGYDLSSIVALSHK